MNQLKEVESKEIYSRCFFILLCIIGALAILSSTMSKNPVLNPFAQSLGTPAAFAGVVAAASTVPGVLISLPAGSLSDIFGRKKALLASSIVFASAPFAYVLVSSWWQLIVVRFYHGFATAMFVPIARAIIVERYPSKKAERISTFTSATIVGRSIAPFLGGFILSVTLLNYDVLYSIVGIVGVTTLIIVLVLLKEENNMSRKAVAGGAPNAPNEKRTPKPSHGWIEAASNPGIITASAVEAAAYYVYGALEFFLTGYLISAAQLDASLIGIVSGMQLALIPVANPFMGRLSDRIGRKIPIILGLLVSGSTIFLIPFTTQFLPLLAISVTYGLGYAMVTSSTPALVGDLAPKESYGAAMGFLAMVMDVGQMLGPIVTGIILASSGYTGSFYSLAVILLTFCVFFSISQRLIHSS